MYIKQIIITGYKSFKERTVIDFDKGYNVIVGINGSGKSTLFDAIQFVLTDDFTKLTDAGREALFHDSGLAQQPDKSATVEIVFDNSDHTFVDERIEVCVKRVLKPKTNKFYWNNRLKQQVQINYILRCAGLSLANPYFIVKQGKIKEVALARDSDRLKLIEEIAGVSALVAACETSMEYFRSQDAKQAQWTHLLEQATDQLANIKLRLDEQKEHQVLSKVQRAVQYVLYEREQNEQKGKLVELEQKEWQAISQFGQQQQHRSSTSAAEMLQLSQTVQQYEKTLKRMQKRHEQLRDSVHVLKNERSTLEARLAAHEEDPGDATRRELKTEQAAVRQEIAAKEAELAGIKLQFWQLKRGEQSAASEIEVTGTKERQLYAKSGRQAEFASKPARDRWLRAEIAAQNGYMRQMQTHCDQLEADSYGGRIAERRQIIAEGHQKTEMIKQTIVDAGQKLHELEKKLLVKQTELYDLLRTHYNTKLELVETRVAVARADAQMTSQAILNGRESVKKALANLRNRHEDISYHGMIIDQLECETGIHAAIEVAVGSRLFDHLIDTEQNATLIKEEIEREKMPGDVTFIVMDRVHSEQITYPKHGDVMALISKLQYDLSLNNVMHHVFGRVLLSRNKEVAEQIARATGLTCVTLNGVQVSPEGLYTCHDTTKSALAAHKKRTGLMPQLARVEADFAELDANKTRMEHAISKLHTDKQKLLAELSDAKNADWELGRKLNAAKEELAWYEEAFGADECLAIKYKAQVDLARSSIADLEAELGQNQVAGLSAQDEAQLARLGPEIDLLRKEYAERNAARKRLEEDKLRLESVLANKLAQHLEQVTRTLNETPEEDPNRREMWQFRVEQVGRRIEIDTREMDNLGRIIDLVSQERNNQMAVLESYADEHEEADSAARALDTQLEQSAARKVEILRKIARFAEKMQPFETMPFSDALERFAEDTTRALHKKMKETNEALKSIGLRPDVACDEFEYERLVQEKATLTARLERMSTEKEELLTQVHTMKAQKVAMMRRTFRDVSTAFADIFTTLEPHGVAKLVVKTKDHPRGLDDIAENADPDRFTGIGIQASFIAGAEMIRINEMSGGQKTLVAFALIMALQACSIQAPFYVLDEVDQSLDKDHLERLAGLIRDKAAEVQFLISTFKPEMLEHAANYVKVEMVNNCSRITNVSKEAAVDFLQEDLRDI